jgi:hypothetical protein
MASQLKVDTLTGVTTAGSIVVTGEGNSTTTNLQQGLAKSWINMDGSGTVGISDSFNVSGISDDGTGQYQLQIATDMANADYSATTGLTRGGLANISFIDSGSDWNATTGTVGFITADNNNSAFDPDCITITVHGDLA